MASPGAVRNVIAVVLLSAACGAAGCETATDVRDGGSVVDAPGLEASIDARGIDAPADAASLDASTGDAPTIGSDAAVGCPVSGLPSTLPFALAAGAFAGSGHPDVAVHVPDGYDACAETGVVVYFHGFSNCVVNAIGSTSSACSPGGSVRTAHHLSDQLDAAGVNAILVAVELRFDAATGDPGALATDGRLRALLTELYDDHLSAMLGRTTAFDDVDHVVLASHSGGYTALARSLTLGGIDVDEVELFDSLYGEIPTYRGWLHEHLARFDPAVSAPLRFAMVFTDGGGTSATSIALGNEIEGWLTTEGDPANLLFDETTATLAEPAFLTPMIVKRSMLSHDGVVTYYFERFLRGSDLPRLP